MRTKIADTRCSCFASTNAFSPNGGRKVIENLNHAAFRRACPILKFHEKGSEDLSEEPARLYNPYAAILPPRLYLGRIRSDLQDDTCVMWPKLTAPAVRGTLRRQIAEEET